MKRVLFFFTLLLALFVPWAAMGQSYSLAEDYVLTTDVTTFNSIVSTGTKLTFTSNDDGYATVTLPFTFPYGESSIASGSKIACSANGFMYLGETSTSGSTCSYNTSYRAVNAFLQQDGHIGHYNGDDPSGAWSLYDETAGTLTIEYHRLGAYDSPYGSYSYQVVFHSNGDIEFIYGEIDHGTATSRTMATYLIDGPDKVFVTEAWATPNTSVAYADRPFSPAPVEGLRYTFTRPVYTCFKPQNLAATLTPGNGSIATLTWERNAQGTEDAWVLEYGTAANFEGATSVNVTGGTPTKNLTGLTAEQKYYARVKPDCDTEGNLWSDAISFTPTYVCSITVYDETGDCSYIPMHGNYFDDFTKSECIIPATELGAMQWGQITSITFYAKTVDTHSSTWTSTNQKVFLKEVNSTTLGGSYSGKDGATIVFDGLLPMPTESTAGYTITFSQPYTYSGGNLLIGVYNDDDGSYNDVVWYGKTGLTAGVSAYGTNSSSLASVDYHELTFLPKTTFSYIPITCFKPQNLTATLTPGNGSIATLTWERNAQGTEDAWVLEYGTAANFEGATSVNVTGGTSTKNLTGLTAETQYYARVKAVCGGDQSQWSSDIAFTTTVCDPITITENQSWTENFETPVTTAIYTTSAAADLVVPVCWDHYTNSTSGSHAIPHIIKSDAGADGYNYSDPASQVLYFFGAGDGFAALPVFANALNTLQISFKWASDDHYYGTLTLGYITAEDNGTYNTFTAIKTYQANSSSKKHMIQAGPVCLNSVPASATRLVFRWYCHTWCGGNIDDIEVSLPSCPAPTNLYVNNVTTDGATINWTPGASESSWDVYVSQTNTPPADNETNVYGAGSHPFTIGSGLTAATTYHVWVRANCGTDDYSAWAGPAHFTTEEVCPDGMVCIGHGTASAYNLPTHTLFNYSLTQQIYTADEIGQAGTISSVAFKCGLTCSRNLKIYMVSTEKATFSSNKDWITVTSDDLVFSGEVPFSANEWTTIDLTKPFLFDGTSNVALIVDDNTGSYTNSAPFSAFEASNQAICIHNDNTDFDPEAPTSYTGDVQYAKNRIRLSFIPVCNTPTSLTATNITAESATLGWTGSANGYNARYRAYAPVNEKQDFESGLGEWTTIDADNDNFTWVLASETPGTYFGLDVDITGKSYDGSVDYIVSGSYANNYSLILNPDNYLVSPLRTLGGFISFWAGPGDSSYAAEHFGVYVSTANTPTPNDFVKVEEWNMNANGGEGAIETKADVTGKIWGHYVVDLSNYEGQTGHVAIRHFNSINQFLLFIDDIAFTTLRPTAWTYGNSSTNSLEIASGLTPETTYEFEVRSDCGSNYYSEWGGPATFTTEAAAVTTQTLTIHYQYENGDAVGDDTVKQVNIGSTYNVVSPEINCYVSDKSAITGTMGVTEVKDTVRYTSLADTTIDEQVVCDSLRWIDGVLYTQSTNDPTYTLTNAAGCDSVVKLHLHVNICDVTCGQQIADIDNNHYPTAPIGHICWMMSNLRTTHYTNGSEIPFAVVYTNPINNSTVDVGTFGRLYNWASASGTVTRAATGTSTTPLQGVCPDGWRLPTQAEFEALSLQYSEAQLRSVNNWVVNPGNNESGFNKQPGGFYNAEKGKCEGLGTSAHFYTADFQASGLIYQHSEYYCDTPFYDVTNNPSDGRSIRCVRDLVSE